MLGRTTVAELMFAEDGRSGSDAEYADEEDDVELEDEVEDEETDSALLVSGTCGGRDGADDMAGGRIFEGQMKAPTFI
jgi:hypothetical protein